MIIDRDKHNKYVVGWKPNYTVPTNQGSSSGTNVTIVYGGGGSGSSTPVSSEAFSYYKVSDGENAITQEAKVQKDVANLSIIGDEGIKVELITDPTIFEASFTSTGTNKGVYKISYGKVTTVVEAPETQAEEPTEPEVVITFPMTITYVSGEKIKAEQFDTLRLLNDTEEVATYPSSGLTIEGDADGILSISLEVYKEVQSVDEEGKPVQDAEGNPVMEKQGLYFNRILLTTQLENQPSTQAEGDSTEEEPQQPTYESLLSFDVVVNIDTVIKLSVTAVSDLWKLDDNGNIYTEYNAYSLKELSAYGLGEGGSGEGAGFLHELGDVSIPDPNAIPDNAILQYNIETGKWEAVELELPEDSATREWVEQKFKDLINGAPADLDTLGEIAIAIQELQQLLDWFSFVDGRIRANYNFWGVGEVSAYGPASGSDPGTGGGAGYLHELGDVTINNDTLTDGQIIVWDEDSQMWVNTDFPGLDEDALELYLIQNKYATQGWVNNQLDPINNKLEEFQTTIDMINDMFEWDDGKIKAKATLYSVGEISAYGAGEGSSGTGGYLHELDDVLLTDLQDDQLLMYDATIEKWINVDKNSVGLNETELEQYLTTHNYVTSDQVVLPTRRIIAGTGLTGGGALSSDVTLSLATSGVTSGVYTKVTVDQYGRVTLGALLAENDIPNIAWSKIHSTPTTLAGYGITDAYTMQQSDERYVNVTGDTMTGNLILPTLQANTSIILGSVKLEYDSANKALKISHIDGSTAMNMYATGEVSAYGAGIGSAGGGKEYLQDLLDVLVTELTDNQLLMYDAEQQKWINIDKDQVGLNETELQNYLTTNQYTTQSWVNQQLEAYVTINQFTSELNDKVDKEDGKGLSSNDFTDELLAKLNGITTGAQGTFTKVTTNGYGQVISGTTLSAADIPDLDWSKIISGKPTTLSGYGITDGVNAVSVTGTGNAVTTASISGHTLTLTKALSFALITGTNATGTWPISITGNAATANKWTTARTITLAGSVIGSTSIDGSGNVTITTTYTTDNISALDGRYVNVTGDTMTGNLILPTLQANTSIILGSVKLEYDSASNALKISNVNTQRVINLYATGEISAYGYNGGSAGGGASALDDLDDVTLSNLQNGQALVYNSSTGQWVNTTIQAGGIDETALAQYLTNNQYVTMPTGDGRYALKAGTNATGTWPISITGSSVRITSTIYNSGSLASLTTAGRLYHAGGGNTVTDKPSGVDAFGLFTMQTASGWQGQILMSSNTATGLYWRTAGNNFNGGWRTILDTTNYASTLDTRYVKKAGDTMTGNLIVKAAPGANGIVTFNNPNNAEAYFYIQAAGVNKGAFTTNNSTFGTCVFDATSKKYLGIKTNGTPHFQGNTLWHAGNDGSGSGLDADLLDGTHKTGLLTSVTSSSTTNLSVAVGGTTKSVADLYATYLDGVTLAGLRGVGYAMQMTTIDASSLNVNTWYPVTINIGANHQVLIAVIVSLDSGTKPSWSTHQNGFSVRKVWYTNGSGWGTNSINRTVLFSDYSFTSTDPVRGLNQMSNSSNEYVYVRGGGKYYFYISHGKIPVLHTSTYTVSEQSVSPTTTAPAAISRNNALITDNVASATQLQTARTINGTAFNGTSNIVTSYWGTARTLSLTGNATGSVSMNGSANVSMSVNVNYATSAGNASTLGGTSKAGLFTALSSSNATNLSVTIGGTTKSITDLYANYAVSAGNADTLDGVHNGSVTANHLYLAGGVSNFNTLTGNGLYSWGSNITGQPNNYGSVLQFSNVNNPVPGTNQHWITQLASSTNDRLYYRTRTNTGGWTAWHVLAFTTDNVASASRLQTARSIWGQSFNGTANVSGNMTGVGSISASGNITAPSFYASSWFRSTGQTGWYSETYGGGWYMTDSTWLRAYNGKAIYTSNEIQSDRTVRAGTGFETGSQDILRFTTYSNKNVIDWYWTSTEGDTVRFRIPGTNNQSIWMRLSAGNPYGLYISGALNATSGIYSNTYVSALGQNSSDARLKTNIRDFQATALIKQLHPKSFEWNDLAKSKFEVFRNTGTQYGLIAQDVKEVMPEWVDDNLIGSGYMGIRYDKLIPVLLQGEIETISRVETLEDKVKRLEMENSKLKAKLSKLERRVR